VGSSHLDYCGCGYHPSPKDAGAAPSDFESRVLRKWVLHI